MTPETGSSAPAASTGADPFAAYVSRAQLARLRQRAELPSHRTVESANGVILFVDVAGFSALTEKLAQQGASGAEELADILNSYFARLTECAYAYGGDIILFAGDAALIAWHEGPSTSIEQLTKNAAACAFEIRRTLFGFSPRPGIALRQRLTIGAGTLNTFELGGVDERWLPLVAGSAIARAANADAHASPGDIVVAPTCWPHLQMVAKGDDAGDGHVRLTSHNIPLNAAPDVDAGSAQHVRAYVPRVVLHRIDAGHGDWLSELRLVTMMFIRLSDVDADDPNVADALHANVAEIQRVLKHYGGSVYQLLMDDKGLSLVAAFGLPPVAHDNDAQRAVLAARDISNRLRALGTAPSIGMATGRAFCGAYGSDLRRQYSVVGPVINLAARLMQAAANDILCDVSTATRATGPCEFAQLDSIKAKGFAEPVEVFRPVDAHATSTRRGRLVGRALERRHLADAIDAAANGRGGLSAVIGEAGIGKSHLLQDAVATATSRGLRVLQGAGDAIEKASPYRAWRVPMHAVLDIDASYESNTADTSRASDALHRIRGLLGDNERLVSWMPLLAPLFAFAPPDNDTTRYMTAQARADAVQEIVSTLLRHSLMTSPAMLVLDDVHWIDSASASLIEAVARMVPELLIALGARPLDVEASPALQRIFGATANTIALDVLPAEDLGPLLAERLGVRDVPEQIASLIAERTGGNPFYAEELMLALHQRGVVEIVDGACVLNTDRLHTASIPDSVQGVVTSRIDALEAHEQLSLKTASVIGRVFAFDILHSVYPVIEDKPRLRDGLLTLERLELTRLETPLPALAYTFRHAITQDVAYETLLFSRRRELHAAVATWFEARHASNLSAFYPTLAHHWEQAQDPERAMAYLELAADAALAAFAGREAERLLLRAGALAAAHPSLDHVERRARRERALGEAYAQQTDYAHAVEHFNASLRLIGRPMPSSRAGMVIDLARQVLRQVAHYRRAAKGVVRARAEHVDFSPAGAIHFRLSQAAWVTGDKLGLLHGVAHTLNNGESVGSTSEVVYGASAMAVILGLSGSHDLARKYLDRSIRLAESAGNPADQLHCYLNAVIYWVGEGQWADVDRVAVQACDIALRIGNRWLYEGIRTLHGYAHLARGNDAEATRAFSDAYSSASNSTIQSRIWARGGQLACALTTSRDAPSAELVADMQRLVEQYPDTIESNSAWGLIGLSRLRAGDAVGAREAAQRALDGMRTTPTAYYALWGIVAVCETCDALDARALMSRAEKLLRAFSRSFAIARPHAFYVKARRLVSRGRTRLASRAVREGFAAAEQLQMKHEISALRAMQDQLSRAS